MNKYITTEYEDDICAYLAEWETGRYGKKLGWAILSKAFGYSRQALSANKRIKAAYDQAKQVLRDGVSKMDNFEKATAQYEQLMNQVAELEKQSHEFIQKYIRWQFNAERLGISIEQLNAPIPPSFKQEMRKRQKD